MLFFVTTPATAYPLSVLEQHALEAASWDGFLDKEHFLDAGRGMDSNDRRLALLSLIHRGLYCVPNESNPRLLRLTEAGRRLVGV